MIEFGVLGPLTVVRDGEPVRLEAAMPRRLLAILLCRAGQPLSAEALIEQLWEGRQPSNARKAVQVYVHRLRQALADNGRILHGSAGYAMTVDRDELDSHKFDDLVERARTARWRGDLPEAGTLFARALGLWRGEAYADAAFGSLVCDEANRLAERRLLALEEQVEIDFDAGRHRERIVELTGLAKAHPYRERLHALLMLGLYRGGRLADAIAVFHDLRSTMVDQLGVEPGLPLQRLHEAMLRADERLARIRTEDLDQLEESAPAKPAAQAGSPMRPRQLPADIAAFTGRVGEMRALDALLPPEREGSHSPVVISAIGGTAGVGKTALAVKWAHRVADRFPDGQLYVNLRGFGPDGTRMRPTDALGYFLDALGVPPERRPSNLDAQIGRYRSLVAGKRMLILLDNALDSEQVRPLLPGAPGCLVLITSRRLLTSLIATEAARPLPLDLFSTRDARDFLAGRLGSARIAAEPEAVSEIIDSCSRLPLALAIAAARAATRPGLPLRVLAKEMREAARDLTSWSEGQGTPTDIQAVFSWSYEALSGPAARLFRLLALHPGPDLDVPAAASLAGLPVAQARRTLAELTEAHLLTEHAPGRFAFHDLLRAYAADLTSRLDSDHDRLAARHRVFDHYLHSAHAADRWLPASRDPITLALPAPGVVVARFADNAQARQWLSDELEVLLAVVQDGANAGFDTHVQQLAWAVATFLLWRGMWDHQVAVQNAALRAARRLMDGSGEADTHRRLVYACMMLGERDQAHDHGRRALELYSAVGDDIGRARTHLGLMWLHQQEGDHHDGLYHAQQCLELARSGGNRQVLALAHNGVGWSHTLLGDHEQAIVHCRQALTVLEELGELATMADVWDSLGHAHHQLGRYEEAIGYYRLAVDRCRELGDRRHEAAHLVRLGESHEAVGDHDVAGQMWRRALEIYDEIGHPDADGLRDRLAAGSSAG